MVNVAIAHAICTCVSIDNIINVAMRIIKTRIAIALTLIPAVSNEPLLTLMVNVLIARALMGALGIARLAVIMLMVM